MKKYIKKLRHFNISYFSFKFQFFFKKEIIKTFYEADFIGVPIRHNYYGYSSSVRKFEKDITNYFDFDQSKYVDNHFQLEFLKKENENRLVNPLAEKLISDKKIGLNFFLNFK